MTLVYAALLDGIAFALGLTLLFDGGLWQQPTGFLLVALAFAYLAFSVLAIGMAAGEMAGELARQAREAEQR